MVEPTTLSEAFQRYHRRVKRLTRDWTRPEDAEDMAMDVWEHFVRRGSFDFWDPAAGSFEQFITGFTSAYRLGLQTRYGQRLQREPLLVDTAFHVQLRNNRAGHSWPIPWLDMNGIQGAPDHADEVGDRVDAECRLAALLDRADRFDRHSGHRPGSTTRRKVIEAALLISHHLPAIRGKHFCQTFGVSHSAGNEQLFRAKEMLARHYDMPAPARREQLWRKQQKEPTSCPSTN